MCRKLKQPKTLSSDMQCQEALHDVMITGAGAFVAGADAVFVGCGTPAGCQSVGHSASLAPDIPTECHLL
jgi:hypothetical protein